MVDRQHAFVERHPGKDRRRFIIAGDLNYLICGGLE